MNRSNSGRDRADSDTHKYGVLTLSARRTAPAEPKIGKSIGWTDLGLVGPFSLLPHPKPQLVTSFSPNQASPSPSTNSGGYLVHHRQRLRLTLLAIRLALESFLSIYMSVTGWKYSLFSTGFLTLHLKTGHFSSRSWRFVTW